MIKKTYVKKNNSYRVTFKLEFEVESEDIYLCGDFNEWNTKQYKMKRLKKGGYSKTIELSPGEKYHFKYFLGGDNWVNDDKADEYVSNEYGQEDSVVVIPEIPTE